jgi:hypothetical protein
MIGCLTMSSGGPGCYVVPVRDVDAAHVWQVYEVDLVRIVRLSIHGLCESYYAPGLRRPIIRSRTVQ